MFRRLKMYSTNGVNRRSGRSAVSSGTVQTATGRPTVIPIGINMSGFLIARSGKMNRDISKARASLSEPVGPARKAFGGGGEAMSPASSWSS